MIGGKLGQIKYYSATRITNISATSPSSRYARCTDRPYVDS